MASPSPTPTPTASTSTNRHVLTPVEKQRHQLEKLLKDPAKPAHVPAPPKEKTIRPPREMMKNIQGSSAGAGSGEFHVYKASRRREYERLKLIEETTKKEAETAEFERKRREAEAIAEAKTSKNRAKRQKKKERAKGKGQDKDHDSKEDGGGERESDAPIKKRRLVNGKELVFKKPGEESDNESAEEGPEDVDGPQPSSSAIEESATPVAIIQEPRIIIHEDD